MQLVVQAQRTAEVAKLQSTIDVLQRDTQEYQKAKMQEIAGLEARIRELILQGSRAASSSSSSKKVTGKQRKGKCSPATSRDGAARPQQLGNTAGSDPIAVRSASNLLDASANSAPSNFAATVRSHQ